MKFSLKNLLIWCAIAPPLLWGIYFTFGWLFFYLWLISQPQGIKGLSSGT
jgi:hypothetical protein